MDVTLPGWAATMLGMVGLPWVNVDARKLDQQSSDMTAALADMRPAANAADAQVNSVSSHSSGSGVDALENTRAKIGPTNGLVGTAMAATTAAPIIIHGVADVVRASKVATLSQLAAGARNTAVATVTGGPLAQASAIAETRLGVARVRQSLAKGVAHTLTPALRKHVTEPLSDVTTAARGTRGDLVTKPGARRDLQRPGRPSSNPEQERHNREARMDKDHNDCPRGGKHNWVKHAEGYFYCTKCWAIM
jgi:hypothetical protein